MKYRKIAAMTLAFSLVFASCGSTASENSSVSTSVSKEAAKGGIERYEGKTAEEIVASLSTEQKAAQMVEGAFYNVSPEDMKTYDYGSVLSNFSELPNPSADDWMNTVREYQEGALSSEAAIPYIYGQDSVHGVNYASGCVIFPHNINMGAANDPEIKKKYGLKMDKSAEQIILDDIISGKITYEMNY